MSYTNIVKLPNGHYQLKGIIRGIFDTLPEQHTAESIIYFVENRQNITGAEESIEAGNIGTEYLEIRTETLNVAQEFDVTLVEELTTRRAEQPSVMSNMKFGADMGTETMLDYDFTSATIFSGDLLFTFIGRNKFNNYGIIEQTDTITNVTVSDSTKNVIQTHSADIDGEWMTDAVETQIIDQIPVKININDARLKWSQFCEDMGDNVQYQNTVILDVMTYDSTKELYSYDKYEKSIDWRVPRYVGVVTDQAEAQALADSYILVSSNSIVVPETSVSPQLAMLYTECPIIIEGTSASNGIMGQDGNYYTLSNQAYRIVGTIRRQVSLL